MSTTTHSEELRVASAAKSQLAYSVKALGMGAIGFLLSLALGAHPSHAARAFAWAALVFGGFMLLFGLLMTGAAALPFGPGRRGRQFPRLPPFAVVVPAAELLRRGWRGDLSLFGVLIVAYAINGPVSVAFLSGYGPGALVAALPIWGLNVFREQRTSRELFVEVGGTRWGRRQFYERTATQ